ncbi:MAG: DNA translocase FtsK 4TM domain-containing protein [Alphaproteobacteria bacterium]|nr:DNA translocase FtsK 4TM domain-containing protein [Alphaproteobacteria bacterium]
MAKTRAAASRKSDKTRGRTSVDKTAASKTASSRDASSKTSASPVSGKASPRRTSGGAASQGPGGVRRTLSRLRPVVLLGGLLGSIYSAVALATWNPLDPSWTHASGTQVTNAGGPVGAVLADLLYQVLGYGAWSVLLVGFALGWTLARRPLGGLGRVLGVAAFCWATLGMVALVWPALPGADFPAGGLVGEISVENIRGLVGPAGTWIVLVGTVLASLPFAARIRLEDLAERFVGGVETAAPKVGQAGVGLGKRAVGGVAAAGAAVAERVRDARAQAQALDEEEGWDDATAWGQEEGAVPTGTGWDGAPPPTSWQDDAAPGTAWHSGPAAAPPVDPVPTGRPAVGLESVEPAASSSRAFSTPALETPATPTQASGRALVEAEWEPTLPPPIDDSDMVRDTIPAAALAADLPLDRKPHDLVAASRRAARPMHAAPSEAGLSDAGTAADTSEPAASSPFGGRVSVALPPEPSLGPRGSVAPVPSVRASAAALASAADLPEPASLHGLVEPRRQTEPPAPAEEAPYVPPKRDEKTPGRRVEVTPGNLISGGDEDRAELIADPTPSTFELPHLGLLDTHERDIAKFDEIELQSLAQTLEEKLGDFKVEGEVVAIRPGPVVTTFEYLPAPGIKISKIANLSDDIAMALKATRVRIVAPIPGKGVVGIEIPNKKRMTVWYRDLMAGEVFRKHKGPLPMALGKTSEGKVYFGDLSSMPHLLVGGTTGSGKSVGVNSMLLTMLYARTPEELKLILIDPKMLEFELYRDIPHLLHPVITEPKLASAALKWACIEMDERYRTLSRWGVRNIAGYNKAVERELEDWSVEKAWRYAPADWPGDEAPPVPQKMPHIVIVIDELADLMMVAAKDVEESIIRIAQKARAAGIHLIVATQRPSVNVITGLIKANMPSRIAFQVRTRVDGRTILDQNGAENLLGKGDMLFLPPGVSALVRLHGPFVSDDEVKKVTDFLRDQASPDYEAQITADEDNADLPDSDEDYDDLYDLAVAYVCRQGKASASMIQREFRIGYNRAARILEFMERDGVVGPADGARPREVLAQSHAS